MTREQILLLIVGTCVISGLFSPLLLLVMSVSPAWYPAFLPRTPSLLFYMSSITVSTVTLILSGIPAAIYERFAQQKESNKFSLLIWLIAAVLISLPAFENALQLF